MTFSTAFASKRPNPMASYVVFAVAATSLSLKLGESFFCSSGIAPEGKRGAVYRSDC